MNEWSWLNGMDGWVLTAFGSLLLGTVWSLADLLRQARGRRAA
jgi:hypothetical protein